MVLYTYFFPIPACHWLISGLPKWLFSGRSSISCLPDFFPGGFSLLAMLTIAATAVLQNLAKIVF